ncbi:hypothetical protein EV132_110159 [Rhizobium sullae]|uniref:Uncharacterized protein n=1 Tax=Rhizobium sullae TaxID=50338 RepID=A0A4R3Q4E6_RHISU|nr:hypothetical protein EV132_110159 [Rhizobium sullae]
MTLHRGNKLVETGALKRRRYRTHRLWSAFLKLGGTHSGQPELRHIPVSTYSPL